MTEINRSELEAAARLTLDLWWECLPHIRGAEAIARAHHWRWDGPSEGMAPAIKALTAALGGDPPIEAEVTNDER